MSIGDVSRMHELLDAARHRSAEPRVPVQPAYVAAPFMRGSSPVGDHQVSGTYGLADGEHGVAGLVEGDEGSTGHVPGVSV